MRFFFLLLLLLSSCSKQTTVGPKVLLIGIDGCRPDSLRDASTPNLDRLISTGAFNPEAQTCARTVSGPSWMSILTGTWPETHGVVDNSFDGYKAEHAQHFLSRIEKAKPELRTASITEWHPLAEKAQAGADFIAKANTTSEVADLAIE